MAEEKGVGRLGEEEGDKEWKAESDKQKTKKQEKRVDGDDKEGVAEDFEKKKKWRGEEKEWIQANYSFIILPWQTGGALKKKRWWVTSCEKPEEQSTRTVSTLEQITLRAAASSINLSQNTSEQTHLKSSRATRLIRPSLLKITFDSEKTQKNNFFPYLYFNKIYICHSQCSTRNCSGCNYWHAWIFVCKCTNFVSASAYFKLFNRINTFYLKWF